MIDPEAGQDLSIAQPLKVYLFSPSPMDQQPEFEQLTSCSDPDFESFYRIYADSIAQRERKPKTRICEMAGRSDYKIFVLKRNGRVIGFSILFLPSSETFSLLEYMAVTGEYRNAGLGSQLFRQSMERAFTDEEQPRPVLLEVDSDREQSADRELRFRRKQFYRRLGCLSVSSLHYILPLAGEGPVPQMDLMIYPAGKIEQVSKSTLERWLKVIYQSVYNCLPEDPRIKEMLLSVADPLRLE